MLETVYVRLRLVLLVFAAVALVVVAQLLRVGGGQNELVTYVADRTHGVERARHRGQQGIGVQLDAAVRRGARLVGDLACRARLRAAGLVEDAGAGGAGADVEREDEHVRYYTPQWISGSGPVHAIHPIGRRPTCPSSRC